jgi:hypothetical protein
MVRSVGDALVDALVGPGHVVMLCVPETYATWADVLRLAVGSGSHLVPGRRASGADPAEDATILGLWA